MKHCLAQIALLAAFACPACNRATTSESRSTGSGTNASSKTDLRTLTYTQIYADANGETHFRAVDLPLVPTVTAPPAQAVNVSAEQPATTTRFAAFEPHWGTNDRDNHVLHPVSSRRFVSLIAGNVWVKTSDGETREFKAGDVLEVLDTAPAKGHTTWVGDEPAIALYSNHP